MNHRAQPSQRGAWLQSDAFYHVAISILLTSGFFLRMLYMTGPAGTDDMHYLQFADSLFAWETATDVNHFAERPLFILLVGIPYKLGGHAIHAAYTNIGYSLLVDILATVFAWRAIGRRGALIVASILALHPLNLTYSGLIIPDQTNALFFLAAAIVLYRSLSLPTVGQRRLGYLISGALAGLAYSCKEPGILMLPPACIYLVLFDERDTSWISRFTSTICLAVGFAIVAVMDVVAYFLITAEIRYVSPNPTGDTSMAFLAAAVDHVKDAIVGWRWSLWPIFLGSLAAIVTLFRRREFTLFALIYLFVLGYLLFGSSTLTSLTPLFFQPRYVILLLPFAAILFAHQLQPSAWTQLPLMRLAIPAAIVIFTVSAGLPTVQDRAGIQYRSSGMKAVCSAIEILQDEDGDFFVEPSVYRRIKHYLPAHLHPRVQVTPETGALPAGFYLVHTDVRFRNASHDLQRATVEQLPRRLRVALDYRAANRFRQREEYDRSQPVEVFENR